MLLRASRSAAQLTKEALVGKALQWAGKRTLGFAGRNWKGVLGTAAVGATAAPMISKGMRQSQVGLSQPYLRAANAGMVPAVPKFQ